MTTIQISLLILQFLMGLWFVLLSIDWSKRLRKHEEVLVKRLEDYVKIVQGDK